MVINEVVDASRTVGAVGIVATSFVVFFGVETGVVLCVLEVIAAVVGGKVVDLNCTK